MNQTKATLILTLLNIRSLTKHSIDIKFDSKVTYSDLILLTETQLVPESNDQEIRNNLVQHTLYTQDHDSDKFCSLAICGKKNIEIVGYEYFSALNAIKFVVVVDTMTKFQQTILLLYQKQRSNVLQYIEGIRYLLLSNDINILLGDFNIDFFNYEEFKGLRFMMNSFKMNQGKLHSVITFW